MGKQLTVEPQDEQKYPHLAQANRWLTQYQAEASTRKGGRPKGSLDRLRGSPITRRLQNPVNKVEKTIMKTVLGSLGKCHLNEPVPSWIQNYQKRNKATAGTVDDLQNYLKQQQLELQPLTTGQIDRNMQTIEEKLRSFGQNKAKNIGYLRYCIKMMECIHNNERKNKKQQERPCQNEEQRQVQDPADQYINTNPRGMQIYPPSDW